MCWGARSRRKIPEQYRHPVNLTPDQESIMSDAIHQEINLPASPLRVYETLTASAQFAAATGAPAEIGEGAGAAFSCFGGMIVGRHIELAPGQRIVQAWRVANWDAGVY